MNDHQTFDGLKSAAGEVAKEKVAPFLGGIDISALVAAAIPAGKIPDGTCKAGPAIEFATRPGGFGGRGHKLVRKNTL